MVFELRLRSCSRPNMFVGRHNVEVISTFPSSLGQQYVTVTSSLERNQAVEGVGSAYTADLCLQFL